MRIRIHDNSARYVKDIFRKVVNQYIECLHNNALFKVKLNYLRVSIAEAVNGATVGYLVDSGNCKYDYYINIYYAKEDSSKQIAFIIAHELAHLLFADVVDLLHISGKCADESTMLSAFQRSYPNGEFYGLNFEEAAADYIADFIVEKLDYEDENGTFSKNISLPEKRARLEFIEAFTSIYGDSLYNAYYIDELTLTDDSVVIHNEFWYRIVTFSGWQIIDEYDSAMGLGAYKKLNEQVENLENEFSAIVENIEKFKTLTEPK